MNLINPMGRTISLNADNDINPCACMCGYGLTFSSALGASDNCKHCGCNCKPFNHNANANVAMNTNRSSS